jgi:hypothetical protein
LFFLGSDERNGGALIPRSASSADPMYIIFQVIGTFKIENKDNVPDIESPRTHTSGNHNLLDALLEVVDGELAVRWIHGAM